VLRPGLRCGPGEEGVGVGARGSAVGCVPKSSPSGDPRNPRNGVREQGEAATRPGSTIPDHVTPAFPTADG
jgi:hypothetical protein